MSHFSHKPYANFLWRGLFLGLRVFFFKKRSIIGYLFADLQIGLYWQMTWLVRTGDVTHLYVWHDTLPIEPLLPIEPNLPSPLFILLHTLIERIPPPEGFSIYYVPWSRAVCKRFIDEMRPSHLVVKSLTHGSWSGNIVNWKHPWGGGLSFDQVWLCFPIIKKCATE